MDEYPVRFEDLVRLSDDGQKLLNFCYDTQLLGYWQDFLCLKCQHGHYSLRKDSSYNQMDGGCWRCTNKKCNHKFSMRYGSWFSNAHLTLGEILKITYFWVYKFENSQIIRETRLSEHTVVDWRNFCREVCESVLLDQQGAIGGIGKTVEIDESKFGENRWTVGLWRYMQRG
jgi:hypothetical protein